METLEGIWADIVDFFENIWASISGFFAGLFD